jgi:hypothetical protein
MRNFIVGLLAALLILSLPAAAFQFTGGKGYLHTNSALLMPPGALDLSFYARGYAVKVSGNEEFVATNGTSAFAAAFGFTRRTELGFTQILYQDLNASGRQSMTGTTDKAAKTMVPGDTHLRFKFGGMTIGDKVFFAFMPVLRYRVARFHDVQFEPYESVGVEGQLVTVLSYYEKPFYPDEAPSFHLNLGYLNHNDSDNPVKSSQSINFLLSGVYPRTHLDLGAELYGWFYATQPPKTILNRENWAYLTPFVRYRLFKGLNFTVGLDALLMGSEDTSEPTRRTGRGTLVPVDLSDYPNYAKWRLTGRISFNPSTAFYVAPTFTKVTEAGGGRERMGSAGGAGGAMDRQSLFRWAVEGQGSMEAADLDLMKIRQERIKAEEELKRLKNKLQEKQKSK